MVLPVAYMAPADWYRAYLVAPEKVEIEGWESFEKQTCRNRCSIAKPSTVSSQPSDRIILSVPVKKVEHKQFTRDIEISYQNRWQHQHWISLVSAYKHTPFFDYYAEFFKPWYEKETRFLWDLNCGLHETIMQLMKNERPSAVSIQKSEFAYKGTSDWKNEELNRWFGNGHSVLDILFEQGPSTVERLKNERMKE